MVLLISKHQFLSTTRTVQLRACLHGGGGPQAGELTRLDGVKK